LPIRNPVDLNRKVLRPAPTPATDGLQRVRRDRDPATVSESCEAGPVGGGEGGEECHAPKVDIMYRSVKDCPPIHFVYTGNNQGMAETWTKKDLFCQWLDEAMPILGVTSRMAVAPYIGLGPNSIKKYTAPSNTTHKPGDAACKKLGDILGRDYRVLLDDPGVAPAGVSQEVWHGADPDLRAFAVAIFNEAKNLSPQQRKAILEFVRASSNKR
ncbi:MAG TPA: hypothetical protein VK150_09795, partial [Geothrix sp.]|nr:hypothetical protein [Geothrix sp.]